MRTIHIPDGFLDTKTIVTTATASAGFLGYGVRKAQERLKERQVPLLGVTAAFIFAAQMINFPIAGGTSGHFLGAVLAAVLLGPWAALLVMVVVLTIQCLGFADGGLTALGANIFNMGVIGCIACYYILIGVKKLLPKNRIGFLVSVGFVSWFSIVLSAAAVAIELSVSGITPFKVVFPGMVGVHMIIGIGEAIITSVVLGIVLSARPDLVSAYDYSPEGVRPNRLRGETQ